MPFQVQLAPRTPGNVRARILDPPSIAYSQGRRSEPSQGSWKMGRNQDRFMVGSTCRSVAVILCSKKYDNQTASFLQAFWSGARGLGECCRLGERIRKLNTSFPLCRHDCPSEAHRSSALSRLGRTRRFQQNPYRGSSTSHPSRPGPRRQLLQGQA